MAPTVLICRDLWLLMDVILLALGACEDVQDKASEICDYVQRRGSSRRLHSTVAGVHVFLEEVIVFPTNIFCVMPTSFKIRILRLSSAYVTAVWALSLVRCYHQSRTHGLRWTMRRSPIPL